MDFKGVIYEMLVEEVRNKQLLNSLYKKWNSEDSNVTPEVAEYIYVRFKGGTDNEGNSVQGIQDSLNPQKVAVANFLKRFSGSIDGGKFEPSDLKSIEKYSAKQIIFLLKQLGFKLPFDEEEKSKTYFFENSGISKSQWVEKSKELWYGDKYKVYDDGKGLRIYQPLTQKDSISFGFYQQSLIRDNFSHGNKWCVTAYSDDRTSNLWQNYRQNRDGGRTFFFVIDDTKEPNDEYHLSALQKLGVPDGDYPFKITNLNNTNGDKSVKINDPQDIKSSLLHIYPQLRETDFLTEVQPIPFDEGVEMDLQVDKLTRLLDQIREQPGEYDFSVQDPDVKRAYINRGRELKKIESFESLDDQDVRLYFEVRGDQNNPFEIITSWDLLNYLTVKRPRDLRDFIVGFYEGRMNTPISEIYKRILETDFAPSFIIKNTDDKIIVVKEKTTSKYGIVNFNYGTFLKHDGITYSPEYVLMDTIQGSFDLDNLKSKESNDDEQNLQEQGFTNIEYVISIFSKNNSRDDMNNFYLLQNMDSWEAKYTLLSHKTWKEVGEPSFVDSGDTGYDFDKEYSDVETKYQEPINEKGGI